MTNDTTSPTSADRGATFIEVLITIVLLGLGAIITMTALRVSIEGSDQHRSKINSVAELEGAGAYLARVEFAATCSSPTASQLTTSAQNRPGANNAGITVSVVGVACQNGLPVASLQAVSDRGDALESLEVVLGGISVLNPEGAGSSGGSCTWGSLSAAPTNVNVHTNGTNAGDLKSNATISLSLAFSGTCSGPIQATISSPSTGSFTRDLEQDPSNPLLLNATLASDEIVWQPDTYTVSTPVSASTTFVVG